MLEAETSPPCYERSFENGDEAERDKAGKAAG
jgi:hypothetical protein